MADILKTIFLFAFGLLLLIKGGDIFVDNAVIIAKKFNLPELLIGATVVSIGTTLPEVMVSATGALEGNGAIAYGNAIGSIICNTALISAITIAVAPSVVNKKDLVLPTCFFVIATALYCVISYTTGYFSRTIGIILVGLFVVYMALQIRNALKDNASKETNNDSNDIHIRRPIVLIIIGAALIAFGARLLVDNGIKLAEIIGVPDSVIGLTFVALGTSLPELVTAITSLIKGHGSLSLGNIIGANLFNLVLVSGLSITLNPFGLPTEKTIAGMNASLVIDVPLMFIVMLIMTVPALVKGRLARWQGILLLCLYAAFVTFQFVS